MSCFSSQGKYYSVNFPLRDGIDDDVYETIFQPIMAKVMETYQPGGMDMSAPDAAAADGGMPGSENSDNSELQELLKSTDTRWAAATVTSMSASGLELATGTSILASIGYRDADGGITLVHQEEVPSPGGWKDGTTFTYNVQPKVRAISDGKSSRMVPTTPLTAGSRYVRADASYNSMRGDQKVTTVFDTQTGKLETIFCESEKGARAPMAVHPVKGEKLVFYQPTVGKDKKTQRFRPVPALVSSGRSAKGKAKAQGDDLKLIDSGIPAGSYVLALTAYDASGKQAGGSELNLTAGGGGGAAGAGGGPAVAPGLTYPDYGYPAVGYDDLEYVDLTQIIPAGEYDQFDADWSDYNFMYEYQVDDFTAADLAYLESIELDETDLLFDREDWSDEFDIYSLEHPGDADGDGTPDATDLDDDNDGTADDEDIDDDDDGDPDAEDDDDDNDGIPDETDADDDGDGTPDDSDLDDDDDGTADADEDEDEGDDAEDSDEDHDGTPDDEDADDDNDGTDDDADLDDDNDGSPDDVDTDDDNDGTSDAEESDEDDDGTPDDEDADDDSNGNEADTPRTNLKVANFTAIHPNRSSKYSDVLLKSQDSIT